MQNVLLILQCRFNLRSAILRRTLVESGLLAMYNAKPHTNFSSLPEQELVQV